MLMFLENILSGYSYSYFIVCSLITLYTLSHIVLIANEGRVPDRKFA